MFQLRRLVLVRHGESDGNSAERLVGSGDPNLSSEGREQIREAGLSMRGQALDLVVASPLRRAWQSARLLVGDAPIRLEPQFREIDFGRWEGRSLSEIEAADPVAFKQWQDQPVDFEYPGGEPRKDFRARVEQGLEELMESGARAALLVVHKGVVRVIVQKLVGDVLERDRPGLGEVVILTRDAENGWYEGQRSSDPPALRG